MPVTDDIIRLLHVKQPLGPGIKWLGVEALSGGAKPAEIVAAADRLAYRATKDGTRLDKHAVWSVITTFESLEFEEQ